MNCYLNWVLAQVLLLFVPDPPNFFASNLYDEIVICMYCLMSLGVSDFCYLDVLSWLEAVSSVKRKILKNEKSARYYEMLRRFPLVPNVGRTLLV
jgi:hypothetical protein